MNTYYNLDATKILKNDPANQLFSALGLDELGVVFRSDSGYDYEKMDKYFKSSVAHLHAYNIMRFSMINRAKQSTPEIVLLNSTICMAHAKYLNYSEYSAIDYIQMTSPILFGESEIIKDMIYRQFYTFHRLNKVCPFNTASEMFEYIVKDLPLAIDVVVEVNETYHSKHYIPLITRHGEQHLEMVKNPIKNPTREEELHARLTFIERLNSSASEKFVSGYKTEYSYRACRTEPYEYTSKLDDDKNYLSGKFMTIIEDYMYGYEEDASFEGILSKNPFYTCVEEKVKKAKKADLMLAV